MIGDDSITSRWFCSPTRTGQVPTFLHRAANSFISSGIQKRNEFAVLNAENAVRGKQRTYQGTIAAGGLGIRNTAVIRNFNCNFVKIVVDTRGTQDDSREDRFLYAHDLTSDSAVRIADGFCHLAWWQFDHEAYWRVH
jgi:hypothetical protein